MATKSTSVKSAAKKAPAKKAPAKKTKAKAKAKATAVVKHTATDVALNNAQSKNLEMIRKNQDRIEAKAVDMLKIANDSGERLIKLRDEIQKKYGRVWKAWAKTPGNLNIGYEQASRYMKLAGATDVEFEKLEATSIEGAVKQIEHMRHPEKAEAAKKAAAAKKATSTVPAATKGIISNATLDEVEACNSVDELRNLIKLCHARIDELQNVSDDDDGDDGDDGTDAEDEQEAIADVLS